MALNQGLPTVIAFGNPLLQIIMMFLANLNEFQHTVSVSSLSCSLIQSKFNQVGKPFAPPASSISIKYLVLVNLQDTLAVLFTTSSIIKYYK